ncbi:helix-turn-helix transcriptional regulator [Vitreoscilla stercoraria]|uniref:AlpA family phage regulatory protein n=1 Tax=Vitreoscilla stercoraria TaxID=61 RepID=A0ABY4EDN0_VITST|nr:AlpA family phage regulatory protein [Vitreoscilla stercoraria]UOO93557.1 AlpA family phage regulatory protein [Vitreoscilla stercoraria]
MSNTSNKLLRSKQVAERLCISRTAIWYKINPKNKRYDPDFPKPFKVSTNVTAWLESEIETYINHLASKRQASQ